MNTIEMRTIRFLVNDTGDTFISGLPPKELAYWKTKLAFTDVPSLPDGQASAVCQGGTLSYSPSQRVLSIPPGLNYPELCYILRTLSDSMHTARGHLPLHGAVVGTLDRQALIFARPNHGKSYLAKLLSESDPNQTVIGDDHVVLTTCAILGNGLMRLRKPGEMEQRLPTARYGQKRLSLGVCFILSQNVDTCEILPFDAWFEAALEATALKYLRKPFEIQGVRYQPEILWRGAALDSTRSLLQANLNGRQTALIRGSHRYAAKTICTLMEG